MGTIEKSLCFAASTVVDETLSPSEHTCITSTLWHSPLRGKTDLCILTKTGAIVPALGTRLRHLSQELLKLLLCGVFINGQRCARESRLLGTEQALYPYENTKNET